MARERVKFMDDDSNDFDLYDFDTNDQVGQQLREAVKTSYGKSSHGKSMQASRAGRQGGFGQERSSGFMPSSMGRLGTAAHDGAARPITAVRAAKFTSADSKTFDPLKMSSKANVHLDKTPETPEEKLKAMESKVVSRLEQSYLTAPDDIVKATELAMNAGRDFYKFERERESTFGEMYQNVDLQFSVKLNMAIMNQKSGKIDVAKSLYPDVINSKVFLDPITKRFYVNLGNILIRSNNYNDKDYKRALDNTPQSHLFLKNRINFNRAVVLIKRKHYDEAADILDQMLSTKELAIDFRAAYNLVICRYMCGDREAMKLAFQRLLKVNLGISNSETYIKHDETDHAWNKLVDAIKTDKLYSYEKQKKEYAEKLVLRAAKIIAPCIEMDFSSGYDWIVEQVRQSEQYRPLYNELNISKAITYVKLKRFKQAIDTLKTFAEKGSDLAGSASTNLAAIYFLQQENDLARQYATTAVELDRYNAQAYNNKGCVLFRDGQYDNALQFFAEAYNNDPLCIEALYNIGLCAKYLGNFELALEKFEQLHTILRTNADVEYHLAEIAEQMGDFELAAHWLRMVTITSRPQDASVCVKLGRLMEDDDKSEAFRYFNDAYKLLPSSTEVIEWLGSYYVEAQVYEKAIGFFEKAAVSQPSNIKWHLLIASCYRRIGNFQKSLETYKTVHRRFPDNIECLKYLVRLTTDLGMRNECDEYMKELKKTQKALEIKEQRVASGGRRGSASHLAPPRLGSGSSAQRLNAESREGSANSVSKRNRQKDSFNDVSNDQFEEKADIQMSNYQERPRTAARFRAKQDEDFGDEELGDDLLPE